MKDSNFPGPLTRRSFLKLASWGACFSFFPLFLDRVHAASATPLFWITDIPDNPFLSRGKGNYHVGVENLFHWMGRSGLKF